MTSLKCKMWSGIHRKRISRRRVEIVMKAARGNYFDWDDAILTI